MWKWLRRGRQEAGGGSIEADLSGATVHGPVAIGEHIVQITADHGAIVNYVAPEQRPQPQPRPVPVRRLPRDYPDLLGREAVLEQVRAGLAQGGPVEVHGPAGAGKTALLRHFSHRCEQDRDVVFATWDAGGGDDVLQFLFEALYECEGVFVPSPAELSQYLGEREMVAVVDDVTAGREELERVMGAAAAGDFLVAGTERLVRGEGMSIALGELDQDAALALFEREAGRALSDDERRRAVDLWRRDGHPLALLQAAELLLTGRADLPPAQALSDEERRVVAPLAALPGAALDVDTVVELTGHTGAAQVLAALERRGVTQSQSPRYTLRLEVPSQNVAPRDLLGVLAQWCTREPDPAVVAASADAIVAALDLGLRAGKAEPVLRLARAADPALAAAGRWGAWGELLERAHAAARESDQPAAEAWALHEIGSRALGRGETELAASALGAALSLREQIGDTAGAALTRHNLEVLGGGAAPPTDPRGPRRPWQGPTAALIATAAVGVGAAQLIAGDDEPVTDPTRAATTGPSGTTSRTDPRSGSTRPATSEPAGLGPVEVTPDSLDFGEVTVGETSWRRVAVINRGGRPVRLGTLHAAPGAFGVSGEPDRINCDDGRLLEPDSSCFVVVGFTPGNDDRGTLTGVLRLDDDGTGKPRTVNLMGTAAAPPARSCPESRSCPPDTDPVSPPETDPTPQQTDPEPSFPNPK